MLIGNGSRGNSKGMRKRNGFEKDKNNIFIDLNKHAFKRAWLGVRSFPIYPFTHSPIYYKLLMSLLLAAILLLPSPASAQSGFRNSASLTSGLYAADGFGSNFYYGARFNHYFNKWRYFVEGSIGFSSLQSEVLQDLTAFQVFDSEGLTAIEFLFGYDPRPLAGLPYFVGGVASINQGGQSRFAYVVGFGKHIPLAQFFKVKKLGIRYDIRDHIFRQKINDAGSFISHNLVFSLGIQYYF